MKKISYEQLSIEVDRLFEKKIDSEDIEAINAHCEFISDFIKACGWDIDSYNAQMMGWESRKLN